MIQDLLGSRLRAAAAHRIVDRATCSRTALCVAAWGWFLYQGVVDPLGGINTLWPLFGIANQMLAGIALCVGTTVAAVRWNARATSGSRCVPIAWLVISR